MRIAHQLSQSVSQSVGQSGIRPGVVELVVVVVAAAVAEVVAAVVVCSHSMTAKAMPLRQALSRSRGRRVGESHPQDGPCRCRFVCLHVLVYLCA